MNSEQPLQSLGATDSPRDAERPPDWENLKLALNNAVWMHAHSSLTLGQAEAAVLLTVEAIAKHYNARA